MGLIISSFPFVILLFLLFGTEIESLSLKSTTNKSTTKQQQEQNKVGSRRRRDFLSNVATTCGLTVALVVPQRAGSSTSSVDQALSSISSSLKPIAVLGANGRTGTYAVLACLSRGLPVLALTRSGSWNAPVPIDSSTTTATTTSSSTEQLLLTVAACDVKDPLALAQCLRGCRGVIYAASASKNGGTAQEIDNVGVVQAGNVCLKENISRYIVISSTATTRPQSLGYIFTNLMGGIMAQKRIGEEEVRRAYDHAAVTAATAQANVSSLGPSFTILRPGGLEEPKTNTVLGPAALEISQGDVLAGIVSRADLAEVAVELAISQASNLRNTALELYYTDSMIPVDREFKKVMMMTNGIIVPRLHGETYAELFQGIQPGIDYYVPSPKMDASTSKQI